MKKFIGLFGLVFVVTLVPTLVAGELTEQSCRELLAEMQPGEDAIWRYIPWM